MWPTGSVQFSRSVVSSSLQPHGLQHTRLPCPSPTPGAYSNSCPLSWWCHPTISSSVEPFSSCLQSFPASGSFLMSQFFTSAGQRIGVSASASVLPMKIQDWFLLGLTVLISLLPKGLSRVFPSITVWKLLSIILTITRLLFMNAMNQTFCAIKRQATNSADIEYAIFQGDKFYPELHTHKI